MKLGGIELNPITDLTKLPQKIASAMSYLENPEHTGAAFKVLMYAGSQPVKGTNYAFIAEETITTRVPIKHLVKVKVNEYKGQYQLVKQSIEVIY